MRQHFKPSSPEAFRLMMEGSAAFTDIEANGMRVDVPYVDRMLVETGEKIREMEVTLREDEVFHTWRKVYGEKADVTSRQQLAKIVFDVMGVEVKKLTAGGNAATDQEAFEGVDIPFVKRWVDVQKLQKVRGTYLLGIRRETVNGYLHPSFNLHFATTYRSSSDTPNFQNWPNRDPRQRKIVRRSVIPRDGHVLLSVDYSALEFRGAAMFWKDPAMLAYASDPTLDIHRDMAAECYELSLDQVSKDARAYAKNKFVFPTLYGSYYKSTGSDLWQFVGRGNIKTKSGGGLYEHLARKGYRSEAAFVEHIKEVEANFNKRFSTWSDRKEKWWQDYLKNGWFPLSTGFICHGLFSYNNLMNTPIQGPSFHCMLWSCIEMNKWLIENRMRTKIIGQIHDSMELDVHRDEFDDVLYQVWYIMTQKIRKVWDWIVVPLEAEATVGETNWYDQKPVEMKFAA
jgi:DNA polymerase-1